jgi:hypothetical protein
VPRCGTIERSRRAHEQEEGQEEGQEKEEEGQEEVT